MAPVNTLTFFPLPTNHSPLMADQAHPSGSPPPSVDSQASTTIDHQPVDFTPNDTSLRRPFSPHHRRSTSVWGEEVHVNEPLAQDDPKFQELRQSLSRRSTQPAEEEEKFDLSKTLQSHVARSEDIKDKRLDVSWKGLAVRGVGADAVLADDMGS